MRILLLSDIHAHSPNRTPPADAAAAYRERVLDPPSYVSSAADPARPELDALLSLANEELGDVDLVLVAGDICNMADVGGLKYIWDQLASMANRLSADLLSVPGNHDMDSRFQAHRDPKGALVSLTSADAVRFVADDVHRRDQFWARSFLIDEFEDLLVLRLNTAAHHGYEDEYEHGRVSPYAVDEIKRELADAKQSRAQPAAALLLCHHHLFPHPLLVDPYAQDTEVVRGSDALLGALATYSSEWLVVHGHRHYPRVFLGTDTGNVAPIVISAGSFGANLHGIEAGVLNSYHLVELDPASLAQGRVRGTVETFVFGRGVGWRPAPSDPIDPASVSYREGFGERRMAVDLADELAGLIDEATPLILEAGIYQAVPTLRFVPAVRLAEVAAELQKRGIHAALDPRESCLTRMELTPSEGGD